MLKGKMLDGIKGILLFVSLFYLAFYIPMTLTFYSPLWMKINCSWHERCDTVGVDNAHRGMDELASYFRHRGELDSFRTKKEKLHLEEVRGIFDKMFVTGLGALIVFIFTFDRKRAARFALINAVIIFCLILVLPFFTTFWRDVFHPLLFDNRLWINNRFDLSYYIMPRQFFKYTVGLLIALSVTINIALWLTLRKTGTRPRQAG